MCMIHKDNQNFIGRYHPRNNVPEYSGVLPSRDDVTFDTQEFRWMSIKEILRGN
jgi:hypothetical protein